MNRTDPEQRGSAERPTPPPRPRLRPTNPATLIVLFLGAAAVGWIVIARDYSDFPDLTWIPAVVTGGIGVLEIIAAVTTKARIDRRPGTLPVDPMVTVRFVVLAKATSVVGAALTGFFVAVSIWLLIERNRLEAAANDLAPAIGNFAGALLLLGGAIALERACRVPPPPDDDEDNKPTSPR